MRWFRWFEGGVARRSGWPLAACAGGWTLIGAVVWPAAGLGGDGRGLSRDVREALPEHALVRLGDPRLRHPVGIATIAVSPDGSRIATGGKDGTVRLWAAPGQGGGDDWADAVRPVADLRGPGKGLYLLAFAPGGSCLYAVGKDPVVRVWPLPDGPHRDLAIGPEVPYPDAVATDGRTLAVASEAKVFLWDLSSGKPLPGVDTETAPPDEEVLAGLEARVRCLALSPDGQTLVAGMIDGSVRLWSREDGAHLRKLAAHDGPVTCAAFGPEGLRVASGATDGVRISGVRDAKAGPGRVGPGETVHRLAFNPDGRRLAVAQAGRLRRYDVPSGKELTALPALRRDSPRGGSCQPNDLAFGPMGAWLAAADGTAVTLIDPATGAVRLATEGHRDAVLSVAVSPDGATVASGGADETLRLWDTESGRPRRVIDELDGPVVQVAYAPHGQLLATACLTPTVAVWDAASGRGLVRFRGDDGSQPDDPKFPRPAGEPSRADHFTGVAFPRGGTAVACWSDVSVRAWDFATGRPLLANVLRPPALFSDADAAGNALAAAWALHPRKALQEVNNMANAWALFPMREVFREPPPGRKEHFRGVALSPDGTTLATASDAQMLSFIRENAGAVTLWDLSGREAPATLETEEVIGPRVAFAADGALLAVDGWYREEFHIRLRLWNVKDRRRVYLEDVVKDNPRTCFAVSRGGQRLALGRAQGTVEVREIPGGRLLGVLKTSPGPAAGLVFGKGADRLVSWGADGTLIVWDLARLVP